jgi:RNA polymerase sigma factor (sigma-70 family)
MRSNMKIPDSDWVQSVLDKYEQPLIRYAAHITGDIEQAREVVQDTFLKLCRRQLVEVQDHAAQWLYTVCRNRALDVRRKERRMIGLSEAQLETQDHSRPELSTAMEQKEQLSEVMTLLASLPANQQEVLRLKFNGDLSYVEISRITSLSVSNVGFLIHIGLKTIREGMKNQPDLRVVRRVK